MREIPENLEQELEQGRRIVGIGYYGGIWTEENVLPSRIHMLYTVVLEDRIRKNAKKTLEFFKEQGVDVKIISGDHVKTVSMTAVIKSCVPFSLLRGFISITMVLGTFGALWILPQLFEISSLQPEMLPFLAVTVLASWALLLLLEGIKKVLSEKEKERASGDRILNAYGKSREADV